MLGEKNRTKGLRMASGRIKYALNFDFGKLALKMRQ